MGFLLFLDKFFLSTVVNSTLEPVSSRQAVLAEASISNWSNTYDCVSFTEYLVMFLSRFVRLVKPPTPRKQIPLSLRLDNDDRVTESVSGAHYA